MRALHLVYLRGPGGKKLRYYPTEFEPLIIPWWFSGSDREIILAFYQQVLGDEPLQRVEVDWYRSLVPPDQAFLQHLAEKRRSTEHLVVVKVQRNDVDLRDVLTHPDLQPFRYVAITCNHLLINENFGQMSELAGFVTQTMEYAYEAMIPEFSLREDGVDLLRPIVQPLLNPILSVEAHNTFIDIQLQHIQANDHRDMVRRRLLMQLLEDMPSGEMHTLLDILYRNRETSGFPAENSSLASLRSRLVLVDDRLVGWAKWLEEPNVAQILYSPTNQPKGRPNRPFAWIAHRSNKRSLNDAIESPLDAMGLVNELLLVGKIAHARATLEAIETATPHWINDPPFRIYMESLVHRLLVAEQKASH